MVSIKKIKKAEPYTVLLMANTLTKCARKISVMDFHNFFAKPLTIIMVTEVLEPFPLLKGQKAGKTPRTGCQSIAAEIHIETRSHLKENTYFQLNWFTHEKKPNQTNSTEKGPLSQKSNPKHFLVRWLHWHFQSFLFLHIVMLKSYFFKCI